MSEAAVRVLLVYGHEPSGHAAAASALEAALRGRGAVVSRVAISSDHHPQAGLAVARGYHRLLRAAPGVWGSLYRSPSVRLALGGVRSAYLKLGGASRLREGVLRAGADVVVSPQAAVAAVLAEARRRGDLKVPLVSVLTDFGAHPFWAEPSADLVFAPAERTRGELLAAGVPAERIRVAGLPIHPAFAAPPSREEARRVLGIASSAPVVLLSGGSGGHGDLGALAGGVLSASPRAIVLVLCGANEGLRRSLAARSDERLRVFGPQSPAFVAALLAAADLHLGKPGGLTAAESLALGVPMLLSRPLPGQEQANARFLLDAGAAVDGGAPAEAARRAGELLADRGRRTRLSENARRAGKPCAASDVADAMLSWLLASRQRTNRERCRPAPPDERTAFDSQPIDR